MIRKGDMVFYNDGNGTWPSIVTTVWSDECVNLTVFTDNGPELITSAVRDMQGSGSVMMNHWREGPFVD